MTAWDAYVDERLDEALASILAQGVAAEVILVDNASDVPVAPRPGVRLVHAPARLPLGAARNAGIEQVRTPYVVVWDADDVMLPGTLAHLQDGLAAAPDRVAFAAAIADGPDGPRHRWPRRWIGTLVRVPSALRLVHCVWSVYPATGAVAMRTDAVRAAGGYPATESAEDWVLGVSLAFRGRLGWSERPGRVYRRHPASVWARHDDARHLAAHARAVRERLGTDPAVPAAVRRARPLLAAAQHTAILAAVVRRAIRDR